MLPHHVHHLEVTRKDRLMVLEKLRASQHHVRDAVDLDQSEQTSGQGMCLAGRGPPPVHRFGRP
jgi:hypothetical protein